MTDWSVGCLRISQVKLKLAWDGEGQRGGGGGRCIIQITFSLE